MYLLDTNVISELVRPEPSAAVRAWVERVSPLRQHLSVLSLGEVTLGVARLRAGRRRARLSEWVQRDLREYFADRLLPVDAAAATAWGALAAEALRRGRPLGVVDGLLLATAQVRGLTFVTRNESECRDRGIPIVNPWRD